MDPKTTAILDDLYKIDPALKAKEADIIKIITEYMATKPDTKFDKKFALELRERLLKQAAEASAADVPAPRSLFGSFSLVNRFAYVLGGVALGIAIILPVTAIVKKSGQGKLPVQNTHAPLVTGGVTKLAREAFGRITANSASAPNAAVPAALDSAGSSSATTNQA